jgi:hypothetical protein
MHLHLWDFGGQEIQQATHQFFYSEMSLFLLLWNARENYNEAQLADWLELIQARASQLPGPDLTEEKAWKAPVLLVATHRDLWHADIPFDELKTQFPRIRFLGLHEISNVDRSLGVADLRSAVAKAAADLPLMGTDWPGNWQDAEDAVAQRGRENDTRIQLSDLWRIFQENGVEKESLETLTRTLDHLGKIRVFLDDEGLRSTVILDPQWLTNRIARVLKNEDANNKAVCQKGILRKEYFPVFWPEETDSCVPRLFVRLMRKFDLLYRLEGVDHEAWLVVQLLPFKLSDADQERLNVLWKPGESGNEHPEITMRFRLEQSIPPGIPTWFIAREHRFSLGLHWRLGCLLADDPKSPSPKYLAMIRSFPEQRYLQITVRGPLPRDFFALLRARA